METSWQLVEETTETLPVVSQSRCEAMVVLPPTQESHASACAEVEALRVLEVALPPAEVAPLDRSTRVVAWNAERCKFLQASAELLASTGAAVFLLSELDLGMARSDQRHTTRELAATLGCGYAFAVEFLELGLGDERERAGASRGEQNSIGYHGGAILTPHPLERPALVRLGDDGGWFDGERGERRVGGRIAVLGTLRLADAPVALAAVHLESHGDPAGRCAQLEALLDALEAYAPGCRAVIGGDLNTHTLDSRHGVDRDRLRQDLEADPDRLRRPVAYEPLFARAKERGYDWRRPNRLDVSTQRAKEHPRSGRGSLKLDWFFSRGVETSDPEVIPAAERESGRALSDHEAIAVSIRV